MPENLFQQRKVYNALITEVRRIFTLPEYTPFFRLIAVNRIQDGSGKDVTIKVEIQHPKNSKVMHSLHMTVLGYKPDEKDKWPYKLHQEAKGAMKKIRMLSSRAREVKDLDQVDGGFIAP